MSADPLSREERRVMVERLHRDLGFAPVPVAARGRFMDLMQADMKARQAAEERAERLRAFLVTVETCSNDSWLAREATALLASDDVAQGQG